MTRNIRLSCPRTVAGALAFVGLLAFAGTADAAAILVNRTPTPPAAIVNDGTGVEFYDWSIDFDTNPDHFIEFVLDPDYDMVQCVFHDLIGWNTGQSISTGDVRMLCIPDVWDWPAEKVAIWDAYDGVMMGSQFPIFSPGWYLDDPVGSVWYP